MDLKAVVISGEAPESDDESVKVSSGKELSALIANNSCGALIAGEAQESDEDNASISSIQSAVDATVCPPYTEVKTSSKVKKSFLKYNSLLHRKLYECNEALDKDICQTSFSTITSGVQELTAVNRQLVKSEVVLQDAACQLRQASNKFRDTVNSLRQLLDSNFLHSVKT